MSTTKEITQTNTLMTTNKYLLENIRSKRLDLETATQSFIDRQVKSIPADSKSINAALFDISSIDKKIQDNHASINSLLSQVQMDAEYFSQTSNAFLRSAVLSDTSQPAQAIVGTSLSFDVYIINKGSYYSWTNDKGIVLGLSLHSSFGELVQFYSFPLDTVLNPPGEETTNGDYGLIKHWQISGMVMPMTPDLGMDIKYTLFDTFGGPANDYSFSYSAKIDLINA